MHERVRNIVVVVAIAVMGVVAVTLVATTPTRADRVELLGSQIKCPVCQGESIANSPADMARDMMNLVEERISQGATDQQIIDELLSSYSGAVLLDPPASGATLLLWVAPFAALLLGSLVIVWWRRHPGDGREHEDTPSGEGQARSKKRVLVGALILVGAFAGIVLVASMFISDTAVSDSVAAPPQDLSEVSNETMEAVVAANLDNPQVNGMRIALAERYFDEGDYSSALPHFLEVLKSPEKTAPQALRANLRLGWIVWNGGGEAEAALGFFDEALRIQPDSNDGRFLKARVLWCGIGDEAAAVEILSDLASDPELDAEARSLVERDLDAIANGDPCT